METPVPSKTPRRKLKRITTKGKLSQKKLRTAINVSLNTSHNLRTLRNNNRSLAHRLEGLKREYRAAFDAYQNIQEENHYLRQKVVSLECIINEPDSYIEEQVNKKFEARAKDFKDVIQRLHADVEGLSGNLKTLDAMCLTDNPPTSTMNRRSYSMGGILSRVPPSIPSPSSLRLQSDLTIDRLGERSTRMEDVMNQASNSLDLCSLDASSETNESPVDDGPEGEIQKDMSMILEQSVILGVKSPLKNIERNLRPEKEAMNSKLPRRVLTRSRERRGEEPDVEAPESSLKAVRKSRRETRVLADDEVNVLGILDIEAPSDLLLSPKLPSSSGDNDEQRKDVNESLSGDGHFKKAPVTTDTTRDAQVKKKSRMKLHKQMNNTQRQETVRQGKGKDALFISNEFALINAHEEITKKIQVADKEASEETRCTNDRENEDHTVHIVEDMDLTMPINVDISIPNGFENHFSNKKEISDAESESSEPPNFEEFCPDAVTLQRTRPGQFKFAASRKETDGSRKSLLSQPPRARSKSKKVIAQMIENLPQEEPKSIFDFHDKTPTQISEKERDMSVYSLNDESSIMSPPTPLGRTKSKSRTRGEESSESISWGGQERSIKGNSQDSLKNDVEGNNDVAVDNSKSRSRRKNHGERPQIGTEACLNDKQSHTNESLSNDKDSNKDSDVSSALGEGLVYNVPLKDVSDTVDKAAARKSRGRSRNRTKSSAQDLVKVSNNEENPSIHTEKICTLDNGMTDSVPVKDDSSNAEKITVRNSRCKSQGRGLRARSQSRTKSSANKEQGVDSEEAMANTNKLSLQSGQKSKLDEGMVAQIISIQDNAVDTLPKETVLGEGLTYSVPIKDDSNKSEKVTVRKSRGRSRTRESVKVSHNSEAVDSLQRTRSRSRCRQNIESDDESCETASHDMQRKSRGHSRTRDKAKGPEKSGKSQTNFEGERIFDNEKLKASDIREERNATNLHQQEMVTWKKTIEQSQKGNRNSVRKQPFVDSQEVSNNGVNSDTLPKETVLGEGVTYSVPIKDDSVESEKVTVRKSRGRSRTRGNKEAADSSEATSSRHRVRSRSRRHQKVEDEDEQCETVSHNERRKSLGRSRTRDKAKGSEKSEKFQTDVERERTSGNEKMNAADRHEERNAKNFHQQEKVNVKKSKEQSQETNGDSICKNDFVDSQEVLSNQTNTNTLPKETVLGEGVTHSVPIKDDSDESEKVTVRKSRGRSRTRGNEEAADSSEATSSHHRVRSRSRRRQKVEDEDEPCETVSHNERRKSLGRSRTREKAAGSEKSEKFQTDVERERTSDNEKMNTAERHEERNAKNFHQQEKVNVKKSKEQSQETNGDSICKNDFVDSQEVLSNQTNTNTLPKETVLGEGVTYSIPLKDDSDESEKVTVRKSRGRSRTRGNEEAADSSEATSSHHRVRSRSQRRQKVEDEDEPCETVSHNERRKSLGRSRTRDKAKGSEKSEKPQTDIKGEEIFGDAKMNATDFSKERQDKNFHREQPTKHKLYNQIAGSVINDTQSEELSEWSDGNVFTVDSEFSETESRKRKSPPKTIKEKVEKSSKKRRKSVVKSAIASPSSQEGSKSAVGNDCTEPSFQQSSEMETPQKDHTDIESASTLTCPQVKSSVKVDGTRANKAEPNEEFGGRPDVHKSESRAGSQKIKTSGLLRKNKKGREQNSHLGKVVCEDQETFQKQIEHLKNLYTPESFKTGKESQSYHSIHRQPILSPSQSPSDSLEGSSATKETDMGEPSCEPEPFKRRRAASKCASYAEPSLGGKLRRGDPFTSGPGNVPIYKSPKAVKKLKVKRDILGPLQNHLVEEEVS